MARRSTPTEVVEGIENEEQAVSNAPADSEDVQGAQPMLADEYSGQGGTYTLDASTGLRVLVQRTVPQDNNR
jgi:hypothetical protein